MSNEHEEYELGRNVTHLFNSSSRKETSVISVRLSGDEIKRLEDIGRESGETVAQVIRDAIAAYRVRQPGTATEFRNGPAAGVGEVGGNARGEAPCAGPESGPAGMAYHAQP